jgi:hemolysin activation/secretion protein
MRYQGAEAGEVEAEVRWQLHPRFSLVAFGGAGAASGREALEGENETVVAGGAGFRYLIARGYGMHLGVDVARGPDQTIFYVVFGNAWFRP